MFKLKSKLIIAVMVMFGISAFMSCEKQDGKVKSEIILSEKNIEKKILAENTELVNRYKKEVKNLKSSKNESPDIFLQYFLEYQILIDGSPQQIGHYIVENDLDELEFFYMFIEKRECLLNSATYKSSKGDGPTDAEIRDALMEECENFFILEVPCKAAVEIAYMLR